MKSNNVAIMRLVVLFVVCCTFLGGGFWWWNDSLQPINPSDSSIVSVSIQAGDGVKRIAANLASQSLIKSPTGFFILIKTLGIEKDIQAGEFRLSRNMDAKSIALALTHGIQDVWFTSLEGWRVEEIATKLAGDFGIPESEFLSLASEGYMFPDTYLIPKDSTAGGIVNLFSNTFKDKITAQMRNDARKTGLSFEETIVLASIIEREGRSDVDRPVIAGILLKRLKADWPLQTDATLQYMLGYQPLSKTWWKKAISNEDKEIRSPYNTYLYTGLPPKPICNPGLSSVLAAIYPKDSEYWFYIHDSSGQVHYAKTLEEHNRNIEIYLK